MDSCRSSEGGGKGARYAHRVADMILTDPRDGTFFFPPSFANAREAIDFWSTVEIPDLACQRFLEWWPTKVDLAAAVKGVHARMQAELDYPEPAASLFREKAVAERTRALEEAELRAANELRSTLRKSIPRPRVRPLLRAWGLGYAAEFLTDPAEREKLWSTEVQMGWNEDGTLHLRTVREYEHDYFLSDMDTVIQTGKPADLQAWREHMVAPSQFPVPQLPYRDMAVRRYGQPTRTPGLGN